MIEECCLKLSENGIFRSLSESYNSCNFVTPPAKQMNLASQQDEYLANVATRSSDLQHTNLLGVEVSGGPELLQLLSTKGNMVYCKAAVNKYEQKT